MAVEAAVVVVAAAAAEVIATVDTTVTVVDTAEATEAGLHHAGPLHLIIAGDDPDVITDLDHVLTLHVSLIFILHLSH